MAARGGSIAGEGGPAAVSAPLAAFVAGVRPDDIPAAVRHEARRSILNGLATALAGARDPVMDRAVATLAPFSGPPEAGVIGRGERFDMLTAAFLNAVATNVFDFDDTHQGTVIHPTAPVSPAVFAFAERRRVSGRALLEAFILGVEVECRIGNAVSPGHYRRGWHITATCGVFGAAAAAGRLLGLDADRMLSALGIASAQAGGLVETLGTMAKSVGVGNAARNGLVAALMAANDVEGPALPLEGARGFLRVTGEDPAFDEITADLGGRWELLRNTYKPYPCGVVLNPVIEACLEIAGRPGFDAGAVESVTASGHPLLRERTDRPAVESGREAQVSAQHAVAVCLLRGTAGLADFSDAAVRDDGVRALRGRVSVAVEPDMPVGAARVVVRLAGGGVLEAHVAEARGDAGRPLSDADIEDKLRELAAYGCPALDPEPLIEAVWALDASEDAGRLMRLARP